MKRLLRWFYRLGILLFTLAVVSLGLPRLITELYARPRIHRIDDAPKNRVAVVLGAGLRRDGTPTTVLADRVAAAVELYKQGKVQKLLMSGDNRFVTYNEPQAMADYARSLGVPAEDIVLDYAGRRTYDTCYRAGRIFGLDEVLLVTQNFHLPRAVFICNQLGIRAEGVSADLRTYSLRSQIIWWLRELPATLTAWLDVWVLHPLPVLGNPEPIFPPANQAEPSPRS